MKAVKTIKKNLKATPKLSKKAIREDFVALMNSCEEGYTGEWDPTGEGREGFSAMYYLLKKLANNLGVDISKAKEI